MTSLATQTIEELGGAGSVLARQRQDHIELDGLLEQLQHATGDEQDEVLTRLWRLVFRHAYAEETVLWPVLRGALPEGEELTLQVEREHQEINELASALDARRVTGAERAAAITRLIELLREDVRDEEDVLLPRLQQTLGDEQLHRLGRSWEVVRRIAPTRPHAVVSRRPPGNLLAALPLALIDHTRDGLDRAARASSGRLRTGAQMLSRGLAGAAGGVERLVPLQAGEKAATRTSDKGKQT